MEKRNGDSFYFPQDPKKIQDEGGEWGAGKDAKMFMKIYRIFSFLRENINIMLRLD